MQFLEAPLLKGIFVSDTLAILKFMSPLLVVTAGGSHSLEAILPYIQTSFLFAKSKVESRRERPGSELTYLCGVLKIDSSLYE